MILKNLKHHLDVDQGRHEEVSSEEARNIREQGPRTVENSILSQMFLLIVTPYQFLMVSLDIHRGARAA